MTGPLRTAPESPTGTRWWPDPVLIGLGAALVRIPSLFAPTQLGYDDGGYGLAAIAMRQGYEPFRDIFSPQGPLFLPLVHAADRIGLEAQNAPRLLSVTAGVVVAIAVYAIAAQLMDRGRARLAGGLTAASGILLWTTGPLTGDGPAAAFATTAIAVAVAYRRAPSRARAAAVTVLAGCAISTKSLLVGPALLIAWLLVAHRRRIVDLLMIPIGAVAIVVALALPWGTENVLDDYVRYHLDKTSNRKPFSNLEKLFNTYRRRDAFLTALAAWALVSRLLFHSWPSGPGRSGPARRARARYSRNPVSDTRFLWWWAGLVFVVLTLQDPMFRNHLSALAAPAALLVARYRPSWRVVTVVGLVTIPIQVITLHPLLLPADFQGDGARIVNELRTLPRHAWALSDEPGLVWRAGLGTDPFFVDPSVLRLDSTVDAIKITEGRIVRAAQHRRVCAVAITAPERFGRYPNLGDRLRALGYRREVALEDRLGLYVADRCRP